MKKRIEDLIKKDSDEKSDGQGFVMYNSPLNEQNEVNDDIPKPPPYTEKMTPDEYTNGAQYGSDRSPFIENESDNSTRKPKVKVNRNVMIIILALIMGVVGGLGGGYFAVNYLGTGSGSNGNSITINPSYDVGTTEAVAAKVLPSVVGITATTTTLRNDMFYGQQEAETSGVGTGIIIDTTGYILTNSHVIMDDDQSDLTVLLADSREVKGTVEWFDATLDLAIVKISADNLQAAELGDSDDVNIGEYCAAIGNPLGLEFQGSITAGVVSGLNRSITASSDNKEVTMEGLIQVDAAINSGNSGGPLLNAEGEVVGINTAKATGEGMGFAIPINDAKPIVESIKESGEFNRVYMGVSVADVSTIKEQYPNTDIGTETGAFIVEVTAGSPAESAGLKARDVIVGIDDITIESRSQLISGLLNYKSGDTIEVKYFRDGKTSTVNVTLTDNIATE